MNDKVEIEITKGNFHKSHRGGGEYTSVGYSGRKYGGASPCSTNEQVRSSIKHAEEIIKDNGDIPIINWGDVKPIPTKNNLVGWCK